MRWDWRAGGEYMETLSVKPGHVHLEQLNAGAPVLDTHSGWTSLDVRGVVVKAWLEENGVGAATVRFDLQDEKAAALFRKIKDGFVKGVSVGYEVHEYEEVFVEGKLTERLAISWTPREISICPMGADHGGQIRDAKPDPSKLLPCKLTRRRTQRAPQPKEPAMSGKQIRKNLHLRASLTAAKAKELAKKWITLVAGDEAMIAELALEISEFCNNGEAAEAAPEAAEEEPGEMSAIEEAAREVTGLTAESPEKDVVRGLYRLETRAMGAQSARSGLSEEQTKQRKAKLDQAVTEGKMTPAERKLFERRLTEGKLTDQDLDEQLSISPRVGPGAKTVEPPEAKDPESANPASAQRSEKPKDDDWKKVVTPDMKAYCEKRSLSLEDFAKSWMESNPGRSYERPSDRVN